MTNIIDKAFILAAGEGTRLRPYTLERPKPLIEIAGKSLIDSAIDHLAQIGIKDITVNTHYMADMLENHLAARPKDEGRQMPRLRISREAERLETGGGIKNALKNFNDEPFFCVSSDWLWTNNVANILQKIATMWDSDKMDLLLYLQPVANMTLTSASGDYHIAEDGRLTRALDRRGEHMWTSVRIMHPRIFEDSPEGAFSLLPQIDRAQEQGRLYGMTADTYWHHISTAADLEAVRAAFKNKHLVDEQSGRVYVS